MKRKAVVHFGKRTLAILLAVAFVFSGMNVTGWQVKAAEDKITVTGADDTSKPVHAKITKEKSIPVGSWEGGGPAEELTQYAVEIVNGTSDTISDWELTIACASLGTFNAGWNGASSSGKNIIVGTYKGTGDDGVWTNATIAAGESANGAGFQVAARELANATYTLTYKQGESSGSASVDDTATDPSVIGSTSDKVKASFTQSNVAGEYHEYFLKIDNQTSDSIGDWIVAIPIKGITKVEDWSSWAKIQSYYTSDYLYITPVGGAVISGNSSFGSTTDDNYKFNYFANSDPSNAVVYYKTGTSSSNAFDSVINNATGGAPVGGGSGGTGGSGGVQGDTTTDLNLDVEYNFAKLLQEALYFYDANMCGELEGKCALDWRKNCHLADKTSVTYDGKTIDVSGGFHDAGDHDKFGLPQGYTASILGLGYYEFKEAYEKTGQSEHFKTILDYFCDYFVRCTVLDDSGNAKAFCFQVGNGDSHYQWKTAEEERIDRPAYFADSSRPATDQVSEAVAALAIHYVNFGNETYLDCAKKLFAMAQKNSKATQPDAQGGSFYGSSSWTDDYCLAAAWLYKATNDSTYLNEYKKYESQIDTGADPAWDQVGTYAKAYGGDFSPLAANASQKINSASTVSNGYMWMSQWGSARYNCNVQLEGLVYDKNSGKEQQYTEWATGQMKFLLGNSADKRCYVVGYNANSSKYPHHRTSAGYSDWPNNGNNHTIQAHVLLGALVGGIEDTSGTYHDDSNDYKCNEVAIDYNAAFTGAAAGLYLANLDNSDIKTELATQEELSAIGVTKYYEASSTDPAKVSKVTLDKTTLSLSKGESAALKATVSPATATDTSVTWSSSDTKIATVDQTGKVTAVAAGTATITVKTTDGGKTAACKVTVTAPGITLDKEALTLKAGQTGTLKPTVTGVTDNTVTWGSSDVKVATIDQTGKVTAIAAGTATITATVGSGANKVQASCSVTVTKNSPNAVVPTSIEVKAGSKLSDIEFTEEFSADVEGTFAWKTTDKTFTIKDNNTKAVVVFTPENEAAYDSEEKEITILVTKNKYASVPAAPELSSATANTVTLKEAALEAPVQYGLKQGTAYKWQNDNVFTGLSEYTSYEFALRYSETDIYEASEAGKALKVTTFFNDANKYKIDLDKLTEENYVEAHDGTISYDTANKVLTLNKADKVYTITGSNKEVEIHCADGVTVKLKGAECNSLSGDGNLTVQLENKSVVTKGVKAEQSVTIQNGSTTGVGSLTVSSGEETAAISSPHVTIEGGQLEATGTGEQKAIEATTTDGSGVLELLGGTVIANADSAPPIVADKIILDGGQVSSDSSPVYSTDPVDKNGDAVLLCSVTYVNGTESTKASVKKGSEITLPPLPAKAGYKANGWKLAEEDTVSAPGETKTISEDVTFTADYTKITGTLEVRISDGEALIAGYPADSGVTVTIANHTTVTIDEIVLALSNGKQFTISNDNITGLKAEDSVEVTVALKNGMGVGSYDTDLTVTCVEGEYEKLTESITRVVGKADSEKPENAPEILAVTKNSVTLVPVVVTDKTVEYGIKQSDGTYKWQSGNRFTNLMSYTTYSFAIRYAETASTNASEASDSVDATTLMDENGKYTVDLTKLDDEGYVDAHDGSISYDATKKELTLMEEETYTIIGNNPDIKIITKEKVTLNLENATLNTIEADKDVDIVLKGTSSITSTDDGQPAVKADGSVTISQMAGAVGSVAITGGDNAAGIEANEVTIESGTVTVTGGKDAAGIVADKVTVSGGTVTITGQGDNPAVKAETTKFDVPVTIKNGSGYKEGGDVTEKPDDKTPEKPEDVTTTTQSASDTTEAPEKDEKEENGKSIKPALICSNILLQKGKSIRLQTNDKNVKITKVSYANKKSKKIVKAASSGKVTAKKTGTASLKVTYKYDGVSYTKTVKVKVQKNQVVSLTKKSISLTLKRGKKANLVNASNMLSSKGMKFSTSNKRYAKVSSSGVVTARKKGTATVTVKIGKNKYKVKIKVK